MKNIRIANDRAEFREWLEEHSTSESECWLEVK